MKINVKENLQTSSEVFFTNQENQGVLKISKLIIPIYQREYDWDQDEIERLLNDLDNYFEDLKSSKKEKEAYFTGAIILEKISDNNNVYEVVDGQQRLTTFFLLSYLNYLIALYRLLNADIALLSGQQLLRHKIKLEDKIFEYGSRIFSKELDLSIINSQKEENEEKRIKKLKEYLNPKNLIEENGLKLSLSDNKRDELLKEILASTEIRKNDQNQLQIKTVNLKSGNGYSENLKILFNYLWNQVQGTQLIPDKLLGIIDEKIENYLKYAGAVLIVSENKDDSFKLFEVLNDTARKLTVLDLLKNYFVQNIGDDFKNDDWTKLKKYESTLQGKNALINDFLKSEGYEKSIKEYSYLSNPQKKTVAFFRKEHSMDYFERLLNLAKVLSLINEKSKKYNNYNNNCLGWYLESINNIKFHWGRQILLSLLHLSKLNEKECVTQNQIWSSIDTDSIKELPLLEKVYLIVSDLLLKIGLIGKVNNLSSKILPETAKKIQRQYFTLLNEVNYSKTKELIHFILIIKAIAAQYFESEKDNFTTNFKALRYTSASNKSTMTQLLYFLYNKGEHHQISVERLTLEHIEPQTIGGGSDYFKDDERDQYVNGIGNMLLLSLSKNASFSNSSVKEKLKMAKKQPFSNDAFINHKIFEVLYNSQTSNGAYDSNNFELLKKKEIFDDSNNPTKDFFINREKFYLMEIKGMIFNTNSFLLTNKEYPVR